MKRLKLAILAVLATAVLTAPPLWANGMFEGYPTANITGNEFFPADTRLSGGANPQTINVPLGQIAPGAVYQGSASSYKNMFRNGDISVNPFQSGTSQAADISNTVTTAADGFRMVGGASSAINWSSQTGATDIVAGQFTKSLRFQRKSGNTDTAQICQISVLTSQDSVALQGQRYVYSFWAKAGANISPTNGAVTVKVASGTGSDESSANFKAGSWTGYTDTITASGSSSSSFPTSVASGVATVQTLPSGGTATWVQYWVSGSFAATTTQVGTEICMTPVGTAGANDWVETSNHQLEIVYGASSLTPTAFEHHTVQQDLFLAQRFLYVLSEVTGPAGVTACSAVSVTVCTGTLAFPVPMRAAPAMTYANGFATPTSTAGSTLGACTTLRTSTTVTSNTSSVSAVAIDCVAATVPAAGSASNIYHNGGSGKITASAQL